MVYNSWGNSRQSGDLRAPTPRSKTLSSRSYRDLYNCSNGAAVASSWSPIYLAAAIAAAASTLRVRRFPARPMLLDLDDPNAVAIALVVFHLVMIVSIVAYFTGGSRKATKLA